MSPAANRHRNAPRRSRVGPRLEPLEERLCLSCNAELLTDGTLMLLGDDHANEVVVDDHGGGLVTVMCKSEDLQRFEGVLRIEAFLEGGNDVLVVNESQIVSELAPVGEYVIDMGPGDDRASAWLRVSQMATPGSLLLEGGPGSDELDVRLVAPQRGPGDPPLDFRAELHGGHSAGGGAEGDRMRLVQELPDGHLAVDVETGESDDDDPSYLIWDIKSAGGVEAQLDLMTPDGDDHVALRSRGSGLRNFTANIATHAGDDTVVVDAGLRSDGELVQAIDLGDGDNRFDGKYLVTGATHIFDVGGGSGRDVYRAELSFSSDRDADEFSRVKVKLNGGLGGGNDLHLTTRGAPGLGHASAHLATGEHAAPLEDQVLFTLDPASAGPGRLPGFSLESRQDAGISELTLETQTAAAIGSLRTIASAQTDYNSDVEIGRGAAALPHLAFAERFDPAGPHELAAHAAWRGSRVQVSFTKFSPDGTPLRAKVSVSLQEADAKVELDSEGFNRARHDVRTGNGDDEITVHAAIAIPNLLDARKSGNESSAVIEPGRGRNDFDVLIRGEDDAQRIEAAVVGTGVERGRAAIGIDEDVSANLQDFEIDGELDVRLESVDPGEEPVGQKRPGRLKWENITLKRGTVGAAIVGDWGVSQFELANLHVRGGTFSVNVMPGTDARDAMRHETIIRNLHIARDALFEHHVQGTRHDDDIRVHTRNLHVAGRFVSLVAGGDGGDHVSASHEVSHALSHGRAPAPSIEIGILGEGGDDHVELFFIPEVDDEVLVAFMNGGEGDDSYCASGNVAVTDFEREECR